MVCSFALVNDLYYKNHDTSELPHNLWCGALFSYIDQDWIKANLFTVADLLLENSKIDVIAVKQKLLEVGCLCSPYLKCCAFQCGFSSLLGSEVEGMFLPNQQLPLVMMKLLCDNSTCMLLLTNWCTYFHLVPFEVPELERIFRKMLVVCKITKFREINFKILSCILATPKIIAKVCNQDNLHWCAWCGHKCSLEHLLLECPVTVKVKKHLCLHKILPKDPSPWAWIFGSIKTDLNPVIWLVNFALYKAHLCVCDGSRLDLFKVVCLELSQYSSLLRILHGYNWKSVL